MWVMAGRALILADLRSVADGHGVSPAEAGWGETQGGGSASLKRCPDTGPAPRGAQAPCVHVPPAKAGSSYTTCGGTRA